MTDKKRPVKKGSKARSAAKKTSEGPRAEKGNTPSSGTARRKVRSGKNAADKQQLPQLSLYTLANTLQQGIVFEGNDRKIGFANPAFCKMFGIPSPQAVLGAGCAAMAEQAKSAFADPEGFVRTVEQRKRDKQVVLAEEVKLADGRVFERDYIPIISGQDKVRNYWIYRDITKRKLAEEALEASQKLLETTIESAPT
jgi:PAS domain S-box-containing protein